MTNNTPQLWDKLWTTPVSTEEDLFKLAQEENSIRWQRMERIVLNTFGSFNGLRVIEIGAGAGTNAALMAKRGAQVTLLDYSPAALDRGREFFARNGLPVEMVCANALDLPAELLGKFDIAMSFGLTEHFLGAARVQINRAHFDLLCSGGLGFISVPNKFNPPYRIFKVAAELVGVWKVGEEYPYSRSELRHICQQIGLRDYGFFGDNFFWSLHFISPIRAVQRLLKTKPNYSLARLKKERGTPIDAHLAYALILYGKK
ncbi:MAG: methyltransferase domain-containing protein [Thermoflexales bacterium]|nr:methyltransferase domain-containing protein [Thermoflexales bacterium]